MSKIRTKLDEGNSDEGKQTTTLIKIIVPLIIITFISCVICVVCCYLQISKTRNFKNFKKEHFNHHKKYKASFTDKSTINSQNDIESRHDLDMTSAERIYSISNGELPTMSILDEKNSTSTKASLPSSTTSAMKYTKQTRINGNSEKLNAQVPVILFDGSNEPRDNNPTNLEILNTQAHHSEDTEKNTATIAKEFVSSPSSTPQLNRKVLNESTYATGYQVLLHS